MADVHRLTDPNTAGAGVASTKQDFARIDGLTVATDDDPVVGHGPGVHAAPFTADGVTWARINGVPINVKGDPDTCGHERATGSFAQINE